MEEKQIEVIKNKFVSKIESGDFIALGKVLGVKRSTGVSRFRRNNKSAVLIMNDIINEKRNTILKLKKQFKNKHYEKFISN